MSLKKCQTELFDQIVDNGMFWPFDQFGYDTSSVIQKYRGAVKCEHLPYDTYYIFSVMMDKPRENIEKGAEYGVIPEICKKCKLNEEGEPNESRNRK